MLWWRNCLPLTKKFKLLNQLKKFGDIDNFLEQKEAASRPIYETGNAHIYYETLKKLCRAIQSGAECVPSRSHSFKCDVLPLRIVLILHTVAVISLQS